MHFFQLQLSLSLVRTPVAIGKPPLVNTILAEGGLALRTLSGVVDDHKADRTVKKSIKLLSLFYKDQGWVNSSHIAVMSEIKLVIEISRIKLF